MTEDDDVKTTEEQVKGAEISELEAPPPPPPAKPARDWRQEQYEKRIGKLTAEKRALEERLRSMQSTSDDRLPASEIDRLAEVKAQELAAYKTFENEARRVANEGQRAFADFDQKISSLSTVQDRNDPDSMQAYRNMVQIAMETGEGAKVLYALGTDMEEAARIFSLPPIRQAIEMAKIANKSPPTESAAPRPISPLGNKGHSHSEIQPDDPDRADKLSMKEWIKRRDKQVEEQRKAEQQRYGRH